MPIMVDETIGPDQWLNFIPADAGERAVIGGMSGSPVHRQSVAAFGGMLSSQVLDDQRVIRVIPGATLIDAVARARSISISKSDLRALADDDRQGKIAQATAEEWWASTASGVAMPETVSSLCGSLREAARRSRTWQFADTSRFRFPFPSSEGETVSVLTGPNNDIVSAGKTNFKV